MAKKKHGAKQIFKIERNWPNDCGVAMSNKKVVFFLYFKSELLLRNKFFSNKKKMFLNFFFSEIFTFEIFQLFMQQPLKDK